MQNTIQYIKTELSRLYTPEEVESMKRIIIDWVTGWDLTQQIVNKNEQLRSEHIEKVRDVIERLKKHEPLQYILGETIFAGLKLKVTPAVLIPRPETEELVNLISKLDLPDGNRILDIGTGSGCIALALKSQLPKVQISACDISAEALEVSWENGCNNQLEVNFFQADILSWKLRDWPVYDLIVSNPPYVTESEKKLMHRNVLDFEPAGALFIDDNDPLLFYRTISEFSLQYLNSGGSLFFEINENFGTEMIKMLEKYGFTGIQLINDLQGKNRMIAALKS